MDDNEQGSVLSAMLWMFFLSILLCWLPVFGTLIAGIIGGKKAGGLGSSILAVFLPGIILGILFFMFASVFTGFLGMGFLAGIGGLSMTALNIGPLLFGAIIGALLAN